MDQTTYEAKLKDKDEENVKNNDNEQEDLYEKMTYYERIDKILRKAWNRVYDGNIENLKEAAVRFMAKYAEYIYRAPEHEHEDITGQELYEVCQKAGKSAAGPDGLEPAEMALLSRKVYEHIAVLLNMVEDGASWPQGMGVGIRRFQGLEVPISKFPKT